ncbi:hypothetical protein G6F68_009555 [Rhizopus microsporus]|nr:hypothetical protein G6F68_009555 [Rhizopus microsporus]
MVPSRTRPSTAGVLRRRSSSRRASASCSTASTSAAKALGRTCSAERSNKGCPKYSSICFICRLTALGDRFMSAAPAAKLPPRNTALRNPRFISPGGRPSIRFRQNDKRHARRASDARLTATEETPMTKSFAGLRAALLPALALTVALGAPGLAASQAAPAVPATITMVVPFPPGGSNDVFARVLAEKLGARLSTTVIVENRPGAGGAIGAEYVARAPKDGSVLMLSSSTLTTNAAVQTNLKYDVVRSFAPVAMLARSPMALVGGKDSPYQSMADLLAVGRKEPGKLTYGSAGLGSVNQMASEILAGGEKTSFTHVPYKGADAVNDLLAGRIDFMFATIPSVIGQIRAGKLRPRAVSTLQRSTTLPERPTIAESGYPGFDAGSWFGFFAPKGTPPAVVDTINREVNAALPALQAQMLNEGAAPVGGTPGQFATFIRQEHDKWAALVRKFEPSAN